jgi:hypothetical protein
MVNPPMSASPRLRKRARAASGALDLAATPPNEIWQKPAFHRHFFIASKYSRATAPTKKFSAR